jgi:hypothetical protein
MFSEDILMPSQGTYTTQQDTEMPRADKGKKKKIN